MGEKLSVLLQVNLISIVLDNLCRELAIAFRTHEVTQLRKLLSHIR